MGMYAGPLAMGVLSGASEYAKVSSGGPGGTTPTSNGSTTANAFSDIAKMGQSLYAQHLLGKQLSSSLKTAKKERKAIDRSNYALLRDSTEQRRSFLAQELPQ